jgi:hypothetical protein
MKRETHDFEVYFLPRIAKIICKFVISKNQVVTYDGDSVEEIYLQCVENFPKGIKAKGIIFLCENQIEAKKNFCALVSMGLQTGYFKDEDFAAFTQEEPDDFS